MTSILTNSSAMVALQTLKSVNSSLADTQNQISTGKTISSAKDNAAVWSISKVMESDVSAIDTISSSLDLGESTVSVARQAAENIVTKLQDMQKIAVNASSDNVDHATLQSQMDQLVEGVKTIIDSAQFNGLNLLDGSATGMSVLSSFTRSGGNMTTSTISVDSKNPLAVTTTSRDAFSAVTTGALATDGSSFSMLLDPSGTDSVTFDDTSFAAGDVISMDIGGKTASYTVKAEDLATGNSAADLVAVGMKSAIDGLGIKGLTVGYDSATPGAISFTTDASTTMTISGKATGGAVDIENLSVADSGQANTALKNINALISQATNVASYYGGKESQISSQSDFLSTLSDAMTTGIGSLVDANMEEASARLNALQTQQQLGVQALSIANQQPQTIMSLFR